MAEGRAADAAALYRRAEIGGDGLPEGCVFCAPAFTGIAYDRANMADSAIANLERYLAVVSPGRLSLDRWLLAPALKRLGELYEAKGDNARAVSHYTAFVPIGISVEGVKNRTVTDSRTVPTNVFGFLDMAAAAGVGAFIGCIGLPSDDAARELGIAFHRELAGGASAAESLWRARVEVAKKRPDDATPLLYVGSGIGWLHGVAAKETAGG